LENWLKVSWPVPLEPKKCIFSVVLLRQSPFSFSVSCRAWNKQKNYCQGQKKTIGCSRITCRSFLFSPWILQMIFCWPSPQAVNKRENWNITFALLLFSVLEQFSIEHRKTKRWVTALDNHKCQRQSEYKTIKQIRAYPDSFQFYFW